MNENHEQTERRFTQRDVDTMISSRLKEERAKLSKELDQRAQELDRREKLLKAKADWMAKGLPGDLLDVIDLNKENAVEMAAELLKTAMAAVQAVSPDPDPGSENDDFGGKGGFEGNQDISGSVNNAAQLRHAFGLRDKE